MTKARDLASAIPAPATISSAELGYLDGVTSAIQGQVDAKAPIASPTFTGTVTGVTKAMVGLGSVDDTADAGKPVSTATQTELDKKQVTLTASTGITIAFQVYEIGDAGPGGGKVFILPSTNGNSTGKYFEAVAASEDWFAWSSNTTTSVGSGTAIGTGQTNTALIAGGAGAASTATRGGYSDWFLPSKDELDHLGTVSHLLASEAFYISDTSYWTSSEVSADVAWRQYVYSYERESEPITSTKDSVHKILAVRSFVSQSVTNISTSAGAFSGCRVTRSADLSLAISTNTTVAWNTETFDVGGYHDNSANTTRLTVTNAGYYSLTYLVQWALSSSSGTVSAIILKNGAVILNQDIIHTGPTNQAMSVVVSAAANDYYELRVYQVNADNDTVSVVGAATGSFFSIVSLGA